MLGPFVDDTAGAAVAPFHDALHALALRHEGSHPANRPPVELGVLVAAASFDALDQMTKRDLGWISPFCICPHHNFFHGDIKGNAVGDLKNFEIGVLERWR
jgi:hypothetical protein